MLAAPGENNKPLFAAKDIVDFYLQNCDKIFPQNSAGILNPELNKLDAFAGPRYDGKFLHSKIQELLGDKKLSQTLTNLVIPTFDIKLLQPIFFSTYETLVAMSQVTKQILKSNKDFESYKPVDYSHFLVISIGTGSAKQEERYSAQESARWGLLGWLNNRGKTPLVDIFTQASSDMVDIHASVVFQALESEGQYLRIQDDTLTDVAASVDNSTKENLSNLVQIGENLLEKPVSRVNLETGKSELVVDGKGGTMSNRERLVKFAHKLSDERKRRHINLASSA